MKFLCQVHVQVSPLLKYALECLRKEKFLLLLGYGYMKNNLAHLGGYLTDQNVADMSDHFHFYFVFI